MGISGYALSIKQSFSSLTSKISPVTSGKLFCSSALLVRDVLLQKMMPLSCVSEDINLPKQTMGKGMPDDFVLILHNLYNTLSQYLPGK